MKMSDVCHGRGNIAIKKGNSSVDNEGGLKTGRKKYIKKKKEGLQGGKEGSTF